MTPVDYEPIAVIGMGCRYPDSSNPEEFWRNQLAGHQSFAPVDPLRWDHSRFYTTGRDPDGTPCDQVAHLRNVDYFAASHFNIAARRAEVMDPQQRLLLEVTWEALQDAGLRRNQYDPVRSGSFVGCSVSEYLMFSTARLRERQMKAGQFGTPDEVTRTERLAPIRAYSLPGALLSMCASVLNQYFDWGGPCVTVDGACASSLLSVHQACQYLQSMPDSEGPAPVAVAAGVYLNLVPDNLVGFARIGALATRPSPAFDTSAEGFLLGEGVGVVVLKKLSEARRDGDRIYCVIRATHHNSDGNSTSPMTPILSGQQRLLREGLAMAGIEATDLEYLECHGTGTPVGDEIELQAWTHVLPEQPLAARPRVGSVKANIGHTLSAAGLAGLMRAGLAIYHATVPIHAGWQDWHPKLKPLAPKFDVPLSSTAWESQHRKAAVTSFGFGGINCLALLEQAPPRPVPPALDRRLPFVMTAPTLDLLEQYCRQLADWVQRHPNPPLSWIAWTLTALRHHDKEARVLWASNLEELLQALRDWQSAEKSSDQDLLGYFHSEDRHVADLPPAPLERKSYWSIGGAAKEIDSQSERAVRDWLARTCGWPLAVPHADPHLITDLGVDSLAVADVLTLLPPREKPPTFEQLTINGLLKLCRNGNGFSGTRLSPSTHPFLLDHALNKTMLLPLASGLDFLAWASNLQVPWTLFSVEIHRPLLFREHAQITLKDEEKSVRLYDVRPDGREVLIMSGRKGALAEAPPTLSDIEAEWELDGELQRFYREQTFHGTRLQGIVRLERASSRGIVGMVRTSIPRDWAPSDPRARWHLDPLVIDSCLQLALYWVVRRLGRAVLPHAIAEVAMQTQMVAGLVEARVFPRPDSELGPTADVMLYQSNRLIGWLRGVQARWVESLPKRSWASLPNEWTKPEHLTEVSQLREQLSLVRQNGNPFYQVVPRDRIRFCHYNYLGLAQHPKLVQAACAAVEQWGCSAQASRIVGGEVPLHRELEVGLAQFLGHDDTLAMVAGHATNVSVISHYMKKHDLILHDSLSHNSILQGALASQARRLSFPHNDMAALDNTLRKVRTRFRRVLLVAEGIYSMDGDIVPLPDLVEIKNRYGCLLMLDEAHSVGVLGATGRGVCEHFGIDPGEVDILMGTLSKTFGSSGGFIAGSQATVDYFRYTLPGFIFSVGMSPPLTAAAKAALDLLQEEPERVGRLSQLSQYFWNGCKELGLPLGSSQGTPVVPIILRDSERCNRVCAQLSERGIEVKPIVYPAVEESSARLRFFLSASHTEEQLDFTLQALRELLT